MSIPAPPFLVRDEEGEARNPKRTCVAKEANALDLLSTVSTQIHPNLSNAVPSSVGDESRSSNPSSALRQGFKAYSNGSKYLGHFLNAQRHGFGICHYPNGHVYTGYWSNGQRSGVGLMRYAEGDCYEGEWKDDAREGRGVFYYNDGMADVALWKGGRSVYGVRWSGDRKIAKRLVSGMEGQLLGMKSALSIGEEVGVAGVPERM
jgi:hypothetical protein